MKRDSREVMIILMILWYNEPSDPRIMILFGEVSRRYHHHPIPTSLIVAECPEKMPWTTTARVVLIHSKDHNLDDHEIKAIIRSQGISTLAMCHIIWHRDQRSLSRSSARSWRCRRHDSWPMNCNPFIVQSFDRIKTPETQRQRGLMLRAFY